MIECIFTIDYEIYGNGQGSLRDLVYEPASQLAALFARTGNRFVNFVEVAEFEQIERHRTDDCIGAVRRQIRELHEQGHEIGLHLHPQWYNARHRAGTWELDYREYNLCTLRPERIRQIVGQALAWLRDVLGDPRFTPLAFRAGNWLFQPTAAAAQVLAERGFKLDSSVFKGGRQHEHQLDYRPAQHNGWYWRFGRDVNVSDPQGALLEIPTYTQMVPFWRMLTAKRLGLQQKAGTTARNASPQPGPRRMNRLRDYLRPCYPLKFDFCRMTLAELTSMVGRVLVEDARSPALLKPLVAIGHTKDLEDLKTVEAFLAWLKERGITVSTFQTVLPRLEGGIKVPRGAAGDLM